MERPVPLGEVEASDGLRLLSGIDEFDRVLGGGVMKGSSVVLGGEPGIGKSTLSMQVLAKLADQGKKVLYVTGEEGAGAVALRARRIGMSPEVQLLATMSLGDVESAINEGDFDAVVVDSAQALQSAEQPGIRGSITQVREVAKSLTSIARQDGPAIFIIGHVTKDGILAGPKELEHLVDVVLSFEGDLSYAYRLLRCSKNRYGDTKEVGVFEMAEAGLREVSDPSSLFIDERPRNTPGSVVVCTMQGRRSLLVEVQGLATANDKNPKRFATGLETERLHGWLAVLEGVAEEPVRGMDIFVNVAGGIHVKEPAVGLGVCVAVVSSLRREAVVEGLAIFGEVGLAGEVRAVPRAAARVAEARKMGFAKIMLPKSSLVRLTKSERDGIELLPVSTVDEALDLAFPPSEAPEES